MITKVQSFNSNLTFHASIKNLPKQQLEQMRSIYTLEEMAKKLKTSPSTVYRRLRAEGLVVPRELNPKLVNYDEIDVKQLKSWVDSGKTLREMGKLLNRTATTVRKILNHFGLKTKRAQAPNKDVSPESMSLMYVEGIGNEKIGQILKKDETEVSKLVKEYKLEEAHDFVLESITENDLRDLVMANFTKAEIAEMFGTSVNNIAELFVKYNLNGLYKKMKSYRNM